MDDYDVIIVGASVAGCAAATLLGRYGLRVALLDTHRDRAHYKRLCTHYIQSSATPVLRRLGVMDELDSRGGMHSHAAFWTSAGWTPEPHPLAGVEPFSYCIRRQTLDPILRENAAAVPTVDLMLGVKFAALQRDSSQRVVGITGNGPDGDIALRARFVIGADGTSSRVAAAAGLPGKSLPNARFGYFAHYRGIDVGDRRRGKMWLQDNGNVAYIFPNDDDVTIVSTMPVKSNLAEFQAVGLEASLLAAFADLPDAPDLTGAERVTPVVGTKDHPNVIRRRITGPGVALVGDAALTGDPVWGIGCGWALQSAAWLADAIGPVLRSGGNLEPALRRYTWTHRRYLWPHFLLTSDFSTGRALNPLERLLYSAGPSDQVVADALWRYGTRSSSPAVLLSPRVLGHAVRAHYGRRSKGFATSES